MRSSRIGIKCMGFICIATLPKLLLKVKHNALAFDNRCKSSTTPPSAKLDNFCAATVLCHEPITLNLRPDSSSKIEESSSLFRRFLSSVATNMHLNC